MSRTSSLLDDGDSYQYRSHDEETARTGFGPSGSGLSGAASGFYNKNRKAIHIFLGVTFAVIILIIIIAVAASSRGEGNDPTPITGPTPVHLGDLTAYRLSTTGPILAYLPDITGTSPATMALAQQYAAAGYQVYVLDYFDGGNGFANGSIPSIWTIANSTARTRLALADMRSQFPSSKIFSTGYCWGGGVGVAVAGGTPTVDVSVVAHAAGVSMAMYQQAVSPLLAIMPQSDAGFNNQAGAYMGSITCTGCTGHVAMFKVYPGVSHGFAVTVNMSDPNAVKQKQAAFDDTIAFFTLQTQLALSQEPVLPPLQQTGSNVTLGGMNTYHTGSGSRIVLYLMDINGWKKAATDLADAYAAQGFNVYMPDYCNGAFSCNGVNVDVATGRVRSAISELRAQYPTSKVYSTGYCYGGGVGLRLASQGLNGVDASAVAHASAVNVTLFTQMTAPLLAVMPQNDNGFNSQVPLYLSTLTCAYSNCSREAAFKVYPGVNHGFAVTVNMSDPNAVMQKQQAFIDTVNFFNKHV